MTSAAGIPNRDELMFWTATLIGLARQRHNITCLPVAHLLEAVKRLVVVGLEPTPPIVDTLASDGSWFNIIKQDIQDFGVLTTDQEPAWISINHDDARRIIIAASALHGNNYACGVQRQADILAELYRKSS